MQEGVSKNGQISTVSAERLWEAVGESIFLDRLHLLPRVKSLFLERKREPSLSESLNQKIWGKLVVRKKRFLKKKLNIRKISVKIAKYNMGSK